VGVWRQYKLRKQLEELRQDWSEQNDSLHRELIELRRQLAALPSLASGAEHSAKPVGSPPPASVKTENIRVAVPSSSAERVGLRVPPTQIERSAPVAQSNIVETAQSKKPEDVSSAPPIPATPAAPPSSVYPSPTPIPEKPPAPITTPSQPKISSKSEPAISRTEPLPTYITPILSVPEPRPASVTEPSQAAARTRLISVSGLEETLGTNWLNKLGIVILVLGIALFGIYELGELGPSGKAALSCVVSAVLLGGGGYLEKKDRYRILGRTGIGGGWALLFFTAYAVNHVVAMHVLDSATADSILMLIVAAGMTVHTLRYDSQVVTVLAFLLGYSTVALSHDNVYSLTAGVILALGLVSIALRRGWYELEFFGILSSYLNHLY